MDLTVIRYRGYHSWGWYPGAWREFAACGLKVATICCPGCGTTTSLADRTITPSGEVRGWTCPPRIEKQDDGAELIRGCGQTFDIKLEGWSNA